MFQSQGVQTHLQGTIVQRHSLLMYKGDGYLKQVWEDAAVDPQDSSLRRDNTMHRTRSLQWARAVGVAVGRH